MGAHMRSDGRSVVLDGDVLKRGATRVAMAGAKVGQFEYRARRIGLQTEYIRSSLNPKPRCVQLDGLAQQVANYHPIVMNLDRHWDAGRKEI